VLLPLGHVGIMMLLYINLLLFLWVGNNENATSCVFSIPKPWRQTQKNELDKNRITLQNIGDSFYHIFTTPYLFLLTLFFRGCGIGIYNVISKNYHMSECQWYIDIKEKMCVCSWQELYKNCSTYVHVFPFTYNMFKF
jgi:hypothetical protein